LARAPKLRQAASAAKKAGYAYVVLDGTLIPAGRVAADRLFYFGKHRKHGMNLQVIASPAGDIVWVSGALPGAVHEKKAQWIWGVLADLEAAGLVTLADKGYQGSSHAKIPYRGKNKPQSQKEANAPTRGSARPASARTPSSRAGGFFVSSGAAPGALVSSPRQSMYCRFARHNQDGKGSLTAEGHSRTRSAEAPDNGRLSGTTRVPANDYAGSRPSLDARFGHVIRYICCGGAVTGKILPLRERSTSTIQAAAVAFCPRRG